MTCFNPKHFENKKIIYGQPVTISGKILITKEEYDFVIWALNHLQERYK